MPTERLKKRLEVDKYVSPAPLSEYNAGAGEVKIYLLHHVGARSVPVIEAGTSVSRGDLIADIPDGKLGARVHSSIDGIVKEIRDDSIIIGYNNE